MQSVMSTALRFFQSQRRQSSTAKEFMAQRGITEATATRYQCGYAPDDWHALTNALTKDRDAGVAVGLLAEAQSGHVYAKFRNRFMFPIMDADGAICGFGGRTLGGEENAPKYLNTNQTELFNKGQLLFGLAQQKNSAAYNPLRNHVPRLIVVEGYLDVMHAEQEGILGLVCPMGTALTDEQIEVLFQHTNDVVMCMDGDAAGQRATERAVAKIMPWLSSDRHMWITQLPEGKDADDLVAENGAKALEKCMAGAMGARDYVVQEAVGWGNEVNMAVDEILPSLEAMKDQKARWDTLELLAGRFVGVTADTLIEQSTKLALLFDTGGIAHTRDTQAVAANISLANARRQVARALASYPDVAQFVEISGADAEMGEPILRAIADIQAQLNAGLTPSGVDIMNQWSQNDEMAPLLGAVARSGPMPPSLAKAAIEASGRTIQERTAPGFAEGRSIIPRPAMW